MNDTQGHVSFESFVFFLSNNIQTTFSIKGIVHPEMKILSLFTQRHVLSPRMTVFLSLNIKDV